MQRKSTRQSRGPDAAEKRWHTWIKEQGICAACGDDGGVYCHHMYGSSFKINKVMIGHLACIGLCQQCDDIITHGSRRAFTDKFGPQSELWRKQFEQYPLKHEFGDHEIQAIIDYGK